MFDIPKEHRGRHIFFNGITGAGKSMLLFFLLWMRVLHGKGFCLIDPLGSTVERLAQKLCIYREEIGQWTYHNVHYLQPGHKMTFMYDPFRTDYTGKDYQNWLPVRIEHMIRAIARAYGQKDLHDQARRDRVLRNVMYFVGTNQKDGTHYGVHRALEVLDVNAPWWPAMFGRVRDQMPKEIAQDWIFMKQMNRNEFWKFTESTSNWLTRFLSPVVKSVFSGNRPPINFKEIVETDGIILVNLRPTEFFSREQGNVFAGLLVNEIIDATERRHS